MGQPFHRFMALQPNFAKFALDFCSRNRTLATKHHGRGDALDVVDARCVIVVTSNAMLRRIELACHVDLVGSTYETAWREPSSAAGATLVPSESAEQRVEHVTPHEVAPPVIEMLEIRLGKPWVLFEPPT